MKAEEEKAAKGKKGGVSGGKNSLLNGRALFTYNKDLFQDDENAADIEFDEENLEEKKEAAVDQNLFAAEAGADEEDVDFD